MSAAQPLGLSGCWALRAARATSRRGLAQPDRSNGGRPHPAGLHSPVLRRSAGRFVGALDSGEQCVAGRARDRRNCDEDGEHPDYGWSKPRCHPRITPRRSFDARPLSPGKWNAREVPFGARRGDGRVRFSDARSAASRGTGIPSANPRKCDVQQAMWLARGRNLV